MKVNGNSMNNANRLTDKEYWADYWDSKKDLIKKVDKVAFRDIFDLIFQKNKPKSSLEIGGFPGHNSIYLKKRFKVDVALLDFVIDKNIILELVKKNNLAMNDIQLMEADIFKNNITTKYDLVFSVGVIEHFKDIKGIIERHAFFLNPDGILFISIPNFTGINGLIQRLFDRDNLDRHNLHVMNPSLLHSICSELGFTDIRSGYYGNFGIWLENEKDRSIAIRTLMYVLRRMASVFFKVFPLKTKYFSPYIVLIAKGRVAYCKLRGSTRI